MIELYSSNVETSLNAEIIEGKIYYIVENEGETKDFTEKEDAYYEYVNITQNKHKEKNQKLKQAL